MKKLFFSLSVFFAFFEGNKLFAQAYIYHPFSTDTTDWAFYTAHTGQGGGECKKYYQYGDTVIQTKIFHKVYQQPYDPYNSLASTLTLTTYPNYIFSEKNKRIYAENTSSGIFDTTKLFILYDFNLQIGDTFYTYKSYDPNVYGIVINNKDSISTPLGYRRLFELRPNQIIFAGCPNDFWLEGIGSLFDLMRPIGSACGDAGEYHSYLNFVTNQQKDTLIKHNPLFDCKYTVGIEEFEVAEKIKLFPNPTNGQLFIEWDAEQKIETLKILDMSGMELKTIEVPNKNEYILNTKNYASGLYLLCFFDKNNVIIVQKRFNVSSH